MGLQDLIKAGREADDMMSRFEEGQEASRLAQRTNERRIAFIEHRLKRAIKTLDRRSSSETDWKYVVKAFQQFADWIEEQDELSELEKLATESEALAKKIIDAGDWGLAHTKCLITQMTAKVLLESRNANHEQLRLLLDSGQNLSLLKSGLFLKTLFVTGSRQLLDQYRRAIESKSEPEGPLNPVLLAIEVRMHSIENKLGFSASSIYRFVNEITEHGSADDSFRKEIQRYASDNSIDLGKLSAGNNPKELGQDNMPDSIKEIFKKYSIDLSNE